MINGISYPALIPTPAAYDETAESLEQYGYRIFAHVLAGHGTATCSDHALETADHFYPLLVIGLKDSTQAVIDLYAETRRTILQTLRWRAVERAAMVEHLASQEANQPQAATQAPSQGSHQGPGPSRVPLPPRPRNNPPSSEAIRMPSAAAF